MMKSVFSLLLSAAYVAAHGYLGQVAIDGTTYMGNTPAANPANPTPSPHVKGANNTYLNCGQSAQPASQVGNANPGSTMSFLWADNGGHWPHTTGPVMTYMASCGSTTCDQYDPTNAEWFLIDRQGQYANGTWVQATINQGNSVSVQIPTNLASGNYMVRHEIIALQLAVSMGGAEFYPSCTQIKVGGSQTGQPQKSDLVTFPGGYSDTDPGIYDPNVFNPGSSYTYPGPSPATLVSQDGTTTTGVTTPSTSGGSSSGSGSSGSTTGGAPHPVPPLAAPLHHPRPPHPRPLLHQQVPACSVAQVPATQRLPTQSVAWRATVRLQKPRSFSRIMRDVIFGEETPFSG
ncbi:glycoside hydrolase family 61 protein J [Amanita rubescens]|nr:glycoside hydrolase family 61 protein J [Amanita rubescens]